MAGGVEYQVTKVDPTSPQTKGMVHQVHKVSEEIAATIGGKVYRARIINDPTAPTVAGKVYQIVLIDDPDDPSVKGMVYNAILTGGSEAVVVGPAVSPLLLPDAIADSLTYVKAFGGTEQRDIPDNYLQRQFIYMMDGSYIKVEDLLISADYRVEFDFQTTTIASPLRNYIGGRANGVSAGGGFRLSKLASSNNNRVVLYGFESGTEYYDPTTRFQSNTRYKYTYDDGVCTLESGGSVVSTQTFTVTDTTSTKWGINCYVSGNDYWQTDSEGVYVYSLKVWNAQGELVMDLVPAVQKGQTMVVGFYDRATGGFRTPTAGTFAAGGEAIPTPDYPMDIVSNNGVLKINSQGQIYTDGTVETIEDTIGNTATAEMLLKVGDYQDVQSILDGVVTRNVGVKVLDGTENWAWNASSGWRARLNIQTVETATSSMPALLCNMFAASSWSGVSATTPLISINSNGSTINFTVGWDANITSLAAWQQFLASQYTAGTPVIIVYPLATATTESVAGQTLQVTDGDNVLEITQASINGLELEAEYEKEVE